MAVVSAKEFKALETPEFPIDIGGGREIIVRRPDLQLMVLKGLLPTPLLGEMVKLVGEWAGADINSLTEDVIAANDKVLMFVNTYVSQALVSPRMVLTQEALDALGGDALLPDDLTLTTRKMIVMRVSTRTAATQEVVAAAKEFPEDGPREGSGPDVPPVPPATVDGSRPE